ncbi:hypothetical protein BC830DRAFT_1077668 [Chytriomyces sp. MP71]|nr:hypothetical protein BC830DRAFT_1077668 [Chytriomyces sp. MP71]
MTASKLPMLQQQILVDVTKLNSTYFASFFFLALCQCFGGNVLQVNVGVVRNCVFDMISFGRILIVSLGASWVNLFLGGIGTSSMRFTPMLSKSVDVAIVATEEVVEQLKSGFAAKGGDLVGGAEEVGEKDSTLAL